MPISRIRHSLTAIRPWIRREVGRLRVRSSDFVDGGPEGFKRAAAQ